MNKFAHAALATMLTCMSAVASAQTEYYMREHLRMPSSLPVTVPAVPSADTKPVYDGSWNYRPSYDYGLCSNGMRQRTTYAICYVGGVEVDESRCRPGMKPAVSVSQGICYNTCAPSSADGARSGPASGAVTLAWSDISTMRDQARITCEGMTARAEFTNRACNLTVNQTTRVARAWLASSSTALVAVADSAGSVSSFGLCSKSG
jgi:hypothetical protein